MRAFAGTQKGFNLIELMIVLIIISVVVGAVALNAATSGSSRDRGGVEQSILQLIERGQRMALLNGKAYAFEVGRERVALHSVVVDQGDRSLVIHDAFELPANYQMVIEVDGTGRQGQFNEDDVSTASLVVLEDGSFTSPWTITLVAPDEAESRIESDMLNLSRWERL